MSRLWTPNSLYGKLQLWLDGEDFNGNGELPTLGAEIKAWHDKSKNKLAATPNAYAGSDLPSFDFLAPRGVEFASGDSLKIVNQKSSTEFDRTPFGGFKMPSGNQFHIFIAGHVDSFASATNRFAVTIKDADGTTENITLINQSSGGNQQAQMVYTNGAGTGTNVTHTTTPTLGTDTIYEFSSDGTTNQANINGGTPSQTTDGMQTDINSSIFFMENESGSQPVAGTLYEVLIFTEKLSAEDTLRVQGYLEYKYGLDVLDVAHKYKKNPPLVNNLFGDLDAQSGREPIMFVKVILDFCDNIYASSANGSTCTANGSIDSACYNTRASCQDLNNYNTTSNGSRAYVFSQEEGRLMTGQESSAYPCLVKVNQAPTEITPSKGISTRNNVTVQLRDFVSNDVGVDPYYSRRNIIASENGTFFTKFLARNPFFEGRRLEVFYGYFDTDGSIQAFDGRRQYIIEKMVLNGDFLNITAKDPLMLTDRVRTKLPTPSPYRLFADLTDSATGEIFLKKDDTKFDGSDISTTDQADFLSNFGGNGETGFIRIKKEILKYQVVASGLAPSSAVICKLNIQTRGGDNAWGTTPTAHKANDTVQYCISFGDYGDTGTGTLVKDALYSLFQKTDIDINSINNEIGGLYSWVDEQTAWLTTLFVNTILSKPQTVNKIFANICEQTATHLYYDDLSGQIVLRAETPQLNNDLIANVTDDHIIEGSFKLIDSSKDRVSRVFYYYNAENFTESNNEPSDFKELRIDIDSDSETVNEYRTEATKIIFADAVNRSGIASSVSQRLLSRFKTPPKTVIFKIDASFHTVKESGYISTLYTGGQFTFRTKYITDFDGIPVTLMMQCLSLDFDAKQQLFVVKAKELRSVLAKTVDQPEGEGEGIVAATAFTVTAGGSGYATTDNDVQFSTSGSGSGTQVNIETLDGTAVEDLISGQTTQGFNIINYGNHSTGDVLTENNVSGSGFQLTVALPTYSNATATEKVSNAFFSDDFLTGTVVIGGSSFVDGDVLTFTDPTGNGSNATATASVTGGAITAVTFSNHGSGYTMGTTLITATRTPSGGGSAVANTTASVKIIVREAMPDGAGAYVIV